MTRAIVIGGGIVGASAAYHLAKAGAETAMTPAMMSARIMVFSCGARLLCAVRGVARDPFPGGAVVDPHVAHSGAHAPITKRAGMLAPSSRECAGRSRHDG